VLAADFGREERVEHFPSRSCRGENGVDADVSAGAVRARPRM